LQYERRFVELFELVGAKLKEDKKYYELHNTLQEKHRHLTTEVRVLFRSLSCVVVSNISLVLGLSLELNCGYVPESLEESKRFEPLFA
jgi:hypothetical protein